MTRDEIMTEWVERLRSGDYEQGAVFLNKDGKFCCLGVLCEIAALEGIVYSTIEAKTGIVRYGSESTILPLEVRSWAGVASGGRLVGEDSLVNMNDSGVSFAKIADVIEAGRVVIPIELPGAVHFK